VHRRALGHSQNCRRSTIDAHAPKRDQGLVVGEYILLATLIGRWPFQQRKLRLVPRYHFGPAASLRPRLAQSALLGSHDLLDERPGQIETTYATSGEG